LLGRGNVPRHLGQAHQRAFARHPPSSETRAPPGPYGRDRPPENRSGIGGKRSTTC
jgi:hypothetical protein